jgi:hypothetical protein
MAASMRPTQPGKNEQELWEQAPAKDPFDIGVFDRTAAGRDDPLRIGNNVNAAAKEYLHRFIRLKTHQYLARGGIITVYPRQRCVPGRSSFFYRPLPARKWKPVVHPWGRPSRLRLRPPRVCTRYYK